MTNCTHDRLTFTADDSQGPCCAVCEDCGARLVRQPAPADATGMTYAGFVYTTVSIHDALRSIANDDPDHCRDRNDIGFGAFDSDFGCKLAARDSLSGKAEYHAAKLVIKYRKQVVANFHFDFSTLKGKKRDAAIVAVLEHLTWTYQSTSEKPKFAGKVTAAVGAKTNTVKHFIVRFPYNQTLVDTLKAAIPYHARRFEKHPTAQWIIVGGHGAALLAFADANNFEVSEQCRALCAASVAA